MPKTATASTGAAKPRARRAARKGKGFKGNFVIGELRDFPVRTMQENEAERRAFFAKAWAQKAAREAAEAAGIKPTLKPAPKAAPKAAPADKARLAALNRGSDSESD